MVQKTIIDTFHKEVKSQRVITERGGCSRSAVLKHIKCKVDWKKCIAHNPCSLKSSVKFPQSVIIWAAMSSAGVGSLCFLKTTVNATIYQKILEYFMLSSTDKLYGDFIFQQDLAPAHTAKGTKIWFNDHGVNVRYWPVYLPDLNPIENYGVLSIGSWETPDPTMQMTWRPLSKQPGLHYTWAVPQADCLHATPHWCSNSCKRRPNQVLRA